MYQSPRWRRYARLLGFDAKSDVDEELRFHLSAKIDDLEAQGWTPDAAEREARRQFGDVSAVQASGERLGKERHRHMQRQDFWAACAQDMRYAIRTFRKDFSFTAISVTILALGIAANTAVFSVVNTVLLRPLPFADSGQLAWLTSGRVSGLKPFSAALSGTTYTVDAFEEYQRRNQSFQQLTAFNPFYGSSEYTLTGRFEPQAITAVMVEENFFPTLGVQPAMGRPFTHEECLKNGKHAVLLSHALWMRQFEGDRSLVGQSITLSQHSFTVAGVLPANFDFGAVFAPGMKFDLFVSQPMDDMRNWGNTLSVVGRLRPNISVEQAQGEAEILWPQLQTQHKEWWGDYTSTITGLKEFVNGKVRRSLIVLWCAVGLIMLIVSVNLSNLLLVRAAGRSKEFAMRSALGAGRGRIVRQLLTESIVLSGSGALLGLALAYGFTTYLARQGSIALPLLSSVKADGAAMLWTLLIAMSAAVVFGLVPGLRASSSDLQEAIKASGTGVSSNRHHVRMRGVLVVCEVALACVLLIGAGLLLRSFLNVLDVDMGFQPSRAAVIKIDYNDQGNDVKRGTILQEIQRKVSEIPGVEAAGVVDLLPLGRNRTWGLKGKGRTYPKNFGLNALVRVVTPGYLAAMGMRLRGGRDFSWQDVAGSPSVVIVNQTAARRYWNEDVPVDRIAQVNGRDARVIGVLADVAEHSLEGEADPEMYLTATQAGPEGAELVVRTKLPVESLGPSVMRTLRALNPGQPATEFRPLQSIVDQSVSPRRFLVTLVASFALMGLILASLGIYGVISYSVTRETQQIGIRMALGATAPQVQRGVMAGALRLATIGIAFGLAGALISAKWIGSLLFGTTPSDPLTFAGIGVLLGIVALIAGYIPARRASRIDPIIALRSS